MHSDGPPGWHRRLRSSNYSAVTSLLGGAYGTQRNDVTLPGMFHSYNGLLVATGDRRIIQQFGSSYSYILPYKG